MADDNDRTVTIPLLEGEIPLRFLRWFLPALNLVCLFTCLRLKRIANREVDALPFASAPARAIRSGLYLPARYGAKNLSFWLFCLHRDTAGLFGLSLTTASVLLFSREGNISHRILEMAAVYAGFAALTYALWVWRLRPAAATQ